MSFTDKFEKLTKDHPVVRNINKQLKKRNVTVKANWWKDFKASELYDDIEDGMSQVYFLTLFHSTTKEFITTCAYCHDIDEFDISIGSKICCNRMADSADFLQLVEITKPLNLIEYHYAVTHSPTIKNPLIDFMMYSIFDSSFT